MSNNNKSVNTKKVTETTGASKKLLTIKQLQQKVLGKSDRYLRKLSHLDGKSAKKDKEVMKEVEVLALQNQSLFIQELKKILPIK